METGSTKSKQPRQVRDHWREAGQELRQWRESLRFGGERPSQNQMDELTGSKRGTWAQMEAGKLHPPDRDFCNEKLSPVVGRDVWGEIAPIRMRRFDPALVEWHKSELDEETRWEASQPERVLLEEVRHLAKLLVRRLKPQPQLGLTAMRDAGLLEATMLEDLVSMISRVSSEAKEGDAGAAVHFAAFLACAGGVADDRLWQRLHTLAFDWRGEAELPWNPLSTDDTAAGYDRVVLFGDEPADEAAEERRLEQFYPRVVVSGDTWTVKDGRGGEESFVLEGVRLAGSDAEGWRIATAGDDDE